MVVIDHVTSYLGVGKVNTFQGGDVRGVLMPLTELAMENHFLVLGIMHFNKKGEVNNALLRVSESLSFGAVARHVYAVIDDPANNCKLLIKAKNNLAPDTKALSYGIGVKNGRSLTAAQERCPRLRRARLKHRDPPLSDIIALQCYTVVVAILPTLRGIYGHTYKSQKPGAL